MKEIRQIISLYNKIENLKCALLTVIKVEGSSYRRPGARMLITENGEWIGGISGGCLENDALKKAQLSIFKNKPKILIYDTTNDDPLQIGVGLGCNGIIHILITPIDSNRKNNTISLLSSIVDSRKPEIFVTFIDEKYSDSFGKTFLFEDINLDFKKFKYNQKEFLKSEILTVEIVDNQKVEVLIEVIKPEVRLLIFGNNYDIVSMASLANELGWIVEIIGNKNKIPVSTHKIAKQIYEKKSIPEIDDFTIAISMCHDYGSDLFNLKELLKTNIKYIGLLGPKKRFEKMEKEIEISEFQKQNIIFAPAGLDIGAETPEEIAISILSEIKTVFSKRKAGFLKERTQPIYMN